MASIGVFSSAQYPQPASSTYASRIRNRFFSENSISLLIIALAISFMAARYRACIRSAHLFSVEARAENS